MLEPKLDPFAQSLLAAGRRVHLGSGQTWVSEGDELSELGYIIDGTMTVQRFTAEGNCVWIMEAGPGDFVGVSALRPGGVAHADIVTYSDVDIILITPARLSTLMTNDAQVLAATTDKLAARIEAIEAHLTDHIGLPLKARISAALLAASIPVQGSDNVRVIRPSPVFVLVAKRMHTTRESVSRIVSELEKKGIISRQPGAIIIENVRAIEAYK